MIQGQWFSPGKDISSLLPVRRAVFSRGADALDGESWNALVFEDDVPAASGRIWYRDGISCCAFCFSRRSPMRRRKSACVAGPIRPASLRVLASLPCPVLAVRWK